MSPCSSFSSFSCSMRSPIKAEHINPHLCNCAGFVHEASASRGTDHHTVSDNFQDTLQSPLIDKWPARPRRQSASVSLISPCPGGRIQLLPLDRGSLASQNEMRCNCHHPQDSQVKPSKAPMCTDLMTGLSNPTLRGQILLQDSDESSVSE